MRTCPFKNQAAYVSPTTNNINLQGAACLQNMPKSAQLGHWNSLSRNMRQLPLKPRPPSVETPIASEGATAKDRLSTLPVELLEDVLSRLSPQQICKARILSRYFKTFIETNKATFLRPSLTQAKARIKAEYKALSQTAELSFDLALRGCVFHYGSLEDGLAREDSIYRFVRHYAGRRYSSFSTTRKDDLITSLTAVAWATYIPGHPHESNGSPRQSYDVDKYFAGLVSETGDISLANGLRFMG